MKQKVAEIIDFETKGNVVRFYLGTNGKQTGDDWDDAPYEHNAGKVYEEYVVGFVDMSFPFDCSVFEPSDGKSNSEWCKEDMVKRRVPCIVVAPAGTDYWQFEKALADDASQEFYFGDKLAYEVTK